MYSVDLTGQVFSSLTAIKRHPLLTKSKKTQGECLCECGTTTLVITHHLTSGNTQSCGCRRVETTRENGKARKTHGMTGTAEYKAGQSMKDRCYNEDSENYHNYGARGIVVWYSWVRSFACFYKDMGPRPGPGYSLDRIDNDGFYQPDNCRWATAEQQANNTRSNVKYLLDGEELGVSQLARRFNIPVATLTSRLIRDKLSLEEALEKEAPTLIFEWDGQSRRLNEWCNIYGLSYSTVYSRIFKYGWSFEKAISPE